MRNNEIEGILIVDKPSGMTSHDVVSCVRKKFNMKRVGHAGTLDPIATGVLVILLGKSTKLFDKFVAFDKAYESKLLLGTKTHSADIQGKIIKERPFNEISREEIENVFRKFIGEIEQVPPMVSAVKVGGKRLYKLARMGLEVERQPRKIRIDRLEVIDYSSPNVKFYLSCSKGTYVRQLADDVGDILGCGACITQIKRVKVGPFELADAVSLDHLEAGHVKSFNEMGAVNK